MHKSIRITFCLLLLKKILQNFLSSNEQKVTSNEQQAKSNEQQAKRNKQLAKNNKQQAKSNECRAKSFTSEANYIDHKFCFKALLGPTCTKNWGQTSKYYRTG